MTAPDLHLPVWPRLDALEQQVDELLAEARRADPTARRVDARETLALRYGVASWARLEQACRLIAALRADDAAAVRAMIAARPALLHEDARGVAGSWGPPMSYAANLGRDALVALLHDLGARDLQHAFDRACLQGRVTTARLLYDLGARPGPGAVMGPAETRNGAGMALLLELGASIADGDGDARAPVAMLLETYCRDPEGKHRCLELLAGRGVALPDTPTMAVHRGRVDLLEAHLRRDPGLLQRTFAHDEIWPPGLGCHRDRTLALHGTPLAGATLLHLCVDDDAVELLTFLLDRGADPNARAAVDARGFGGHTALFGCVVSQPFRVGRRRDTAVAELLLDRGARVDVRASLEKQLRFVADESLHTYRDVTPIEWGERFHDRSWVHGAVVELLRGR